MQTFEVLIPSDVGSSNYIELGQLLLANGQQQVATPIPIQHIQQRSQETTSSFDILLMVAGALVAAGWFFALRKKKPNVSSNESPSNRGSEKSSLMEKYLKSKNAVLEIEYVQDGGSVYRIVKLTSESGGIQFERNKVEEYEAKNNPPGTREVHVNTDDVRGVTQENPDGTTRWWAILWGKKR